MAIGERFRNLFKKQEPLEPLEAERKLKVRSGYNMREMGGYACGNNQTLYHRFIRSGSLETLTERDQERLYDYGVRMVLDLRGNHEREAAPDTLVDWEGVRSLHVRLYDVDISDPKLNNPDDDFLVSTYLKMLANKDAVRDIFSFFATAADDECVLYHCTAGMDRTGMTSMLLLGLCGARPARIVSDYCYSFGPVEEVDYAVNNRPSTVRHELQVRLKAISTVYRQLLSAYGSPAKYLYRCGVTKDEMIAVRHHLLG